jgi:hypothetical protein
MTDQNPGPDDPTQVVPISPDPLVPPPPAAVDAAAPVEAVTSAAAAAAITPPLQPARLEPVTPPASAAPKSSRGRWAAAIAVAVLVVAITAGVVFALVGRSPDATVIGYVPTGAVAYGEVRLDLPGDQRQAVGEFLSHFPGFADQTALDTKLDEVLDQVVGDASDGKQSFTKDIKPWFDGELAFSAGPLPDPSTLGADSAKAMGNALVLLSIKDATAAQAWFDAAFKEAGATTTTESYGGSTLTVFSKSDGPTAAFAIVDGKVAIAGEIGAVKAAIDTKGNSGFAAGADAKAALDSVDGDHIGFVYVALKPLMSWATEVGGAMGGDLGAGAAGPLTEAMSGFIPDWGAFALRVEGDAIVMEANAPKAETSLGPTEDRESDVAKHVPSTAVVLAVGHDTGKTLKGALDQYKDDPNAKEVVGALDQALGILGGADSAIGWIGDTGLVVNRSGDAVEGGLVITPTDAEAASRLFTSIRNLAALSGAAGITFSEEDHNGVTISVATIDLAGLAGGAAPTVFKAPIDKVQLAWAVTDDVVVLGTGPEFVKHVLDTTDATSLAGTDRYQGLMDRVGPGTGSVFVDIAAARELAEGSMADLDAAARKDYETDVKPFLAPFDAFVASTSTGGDLTSSKAIITVK